MPPPLAPPGEPRRFRVSPRAFERLALLSLVALVFIIVTGAAVRLSDSGLGCSNWPACEGSQLVAPLEFHPMVEFVNRMITGLVSVAVILAVLASLFRQPRRRDLTWLSIGLVVGVFGNAVLGGMVVLFGLKPIFVTLHYLLSIVLVWNALVLHHRAAEPEAPTTAPASSLGPAHLIVSVRLQLLGRILCALVTVVLITGTVVTGAGPHAGDASAERYAFAISDVARIHGASVWCFLAVAVATLWQAGREGVPHQVLQHGRWLVGAVLAQGALGYAQYFSGVPVTMVIVHLFGSVLVFVAAVSFYLAMYTRAVPVDLSASGSFAAAENAGKSGDDRSKGPRSGDDTVVAR